MSKAKDVTEVITLRKPKIAPTIEIKYKKGKNFGIALADLHSQLRQVAVCYETLGDKLSKEELRRGKPAHWAFSQLHRLREEIPSDALLRDVSGFYRTFADRWNGYWLHGFIDAHQFLDAIERSFHLALSGNSDFTRPLRELNERFPYRQEQYNVRIY